MPSWLCSAECSGALAGSCVVVVVARPRAGRDRMGGAPLVHVLPKSAAKTSPAHNRLLRMERLQVCCGERAKFMRKAMRLVMGVIVTRAGDECIIMRWCDVVMRCGDTWTWEHRWLW